MLLASRYTELFSKSPKSHLLAKDGFASLEATEPEPPTSYFFNEINRKVALGYGSFLDHEYEVHVSSWPRMT